MLSTARNDLEAATILKEHGKYSLACFHAQQAAEKAVKALFIPWKMNRGALDRKTVGSRHERIPKHKPALLSLMAGAKRLDQFYIPTRYPNGVRI